jgi:hypothetical protein
LTLNKREKWIAIALGAVVVIVAGQSFLLGPYVTARADLNDQIVKEERKIDTTTKLLGNRQRVRDNWKLQIASGLKSNGSDAEIQSLHAFRDWAQSSRVTVESVKSDQAEQTGDFQQIHITVTVTGNMSGLAHWLWDLETTQLPMKIGDVRLSARKEGTDDLSLQASVNTLVFAPLPPKATANSAAKGAAK